MISIFIMLLLITTKGMLLESWEDQGRRNKRIPGQNSLAIEIQDEDKVLDLLQKICDSVITAVVLLLIHFYSFPSNQRCSHYIQWSRLACPESKSEGTLVQKHGEAISVAQAHDTGLTEEICLGRVVDHVVDKGVAVEVGEYFGWQGADIFVHANRCGVDDNGRRVGNEKTGIVEAEDRAVIAVLYVCCQELGTFQVTIEDDETLNSCRGQSKGGTTGCISNTQQDGGVPFEGDLPILPESADALLF